MVAFTWLPGALVCLSLQERCSDAGALQWKVACVLSAASVALPAVEPLEPGSLLLHSAVRSRRRELSGVLDASLVLLLVMLLVYCLWLRWGRGCAWRD